MVQVPKTLSGEIERRIRNRIFLAFAVIFVTGFSISLFQAKSDFYEFEKNLVNSSELLAEQIVSELRVDNTGAVALMLEKENQNRLWQITWQKNLQKKTGLYFWECGIEKWCYVVPLTGFGDSHYGALLYSGPILSLPFIWEIVVVRGLFFLIFTIVILALLLPVARTIPNELFAKPVLRLIDLVLERQAEIPTGHCSTEFTEILEIETRLRDLISRNRILEDLRVASERDSAIARTTQILAHDVRKPFTLLQVIIDNTEGISDPLSVKKFLNDSLPEVQQAIASVNGMISDVLEIGSDSLAFAEPTQIETLVESALNELVRIKPECDIVFSHQWQHEHKINVDTLKVSRVFSNIIGNALQAMIQPGNIWFRTQNTDENNLPFVQICIGNSGSHIAPEHLPKLFDAFYTSGKKGGTGLGLAIAQKIVNAHGGKIWCESDLQKGVEFYFTLPCSEELRDPSAATLPSSSAQIKENYALLKKQNKSDSSGEVDQLEVTLEKEIIHLIKENQRPLTLLIVDDEAIYRNSIKALVTRSADLSNSISMTTATNSEEANKALTQNPDLMILDVDMGPNSLNGYEVLMRCRQGGFKGTICIHSNRSSAGDLRTALEAGADAVLPKPLGRPHLLKLILQTAQKMTADLNLVKQVPTLVDATPVLPEIAVVDDSNIFLKTWKYKLSANAIVHTFTCPRDFREHVSQNNEFLNRLQLIIIDYHFDNEPFENGVTFAQSLIPFFKKPMYLCSQQDFENHEIAPYFEATIPKSPTDWLTLQTNIKLGKLKSE